MKNIFKILLCLFVLAGIVGVSFAQSYLIENAYLRYIVNKELGQDASYSASKEELSSINNILNLNELGTYVQFDTLEGLQYLTNVTTLQIQKAIIAQEDLKYFKQMPKLQWLSIADSYILGEGTQLTLNNVKVNGQLHESYLLNLQKVVDISEIGEIATLNSLQISFVNVQNGFQPRSKFLLSNLKKLENLSFLEMGGFGETDDPSFSWMSSLVNLKTMHLHESDLNDISAIASLTNITDLTVVGTHVTNFLPILNNANFTSTNANVTEVPMQYYDSNYQMDVNTGIQIGNARVTNVTIPQSQNGVYGFYGSGYYIDSEGYLHFLIQLRSLSGFKTYNWENGTYDNLRYGLGFGFTALTENNKSITFGNENYNSVSIPVGKVVVYDLNDDSGKQEISYLTVDAPIENKVISKRGYSFYGWYTDAQTTQPFNFDEINYTNIILYAKWSQLNEYTITYTDGLENEIFEPVSYTAYEGETTPIFDKVINREGYILKGWSPKIAENVTESQIYTAQWEKVNLSVTFTNKDNTVVITQVPYGETLSEPSHPSYPDYEFIGWFKDEALTEPFDFRVPITENIVLYAGYKQIPTTVHVEKKNEIVPNTIPEKVEYKVPKTSVSGSVVLEFLKNIFGF